MSEQILTPELSSEVAQQQINPGQSFQNGESTTAYSSDNDKNSYTLGDALGGVAGIAGGAVTGSLGVVSSAANIVGSGIQNAALAAEITAKALEKLQTQLMDYVAEKTVELMTIPMDKFSEAMKNEISNETFQPKQIIEKLTKGAEEFAKECGEEFDKQSQMEINNGAMEKVQQASKTVTDKLEKAKGELDKITKYIQNGPVWLEKQLNKYIDVAVTQTTSNIDELTKNFTETKNTWAESAGKAAGQKVVQPINKKLVDSQKAIMDKIEKTKAQAISKAKAGIAQAMMKIKGLLGG